MKKREDDKLGYQGGGQATTMPNPNEKVEFRPGIPPRQHNPAMQQHSFGYEQPPMNPRGMNINPQKNDNPVQQFQPSAQHGFRPPMSSFFPPETGLTRSQNPHYLPNQHLQFYCSAPGQPPFPSYGHAPYYSPQYPGYPLTYPASPYQQGGSYYQPYYQASAMDQSQNPNDKSVRPSESRSPSQSAARSKHQDNVDKDVEMKNESVLKELPEVQQQRQQGSSITGKDDEQKQHKEKEEQIMTAPSRKLKVSHIPKGVSHDALQLFFENEKKSGGGEVKDLDFDTDSSTAVIEFEDPSVIDRMLQRLPLVIQQKQLKIEVYKEVDESEKVVVDKDENNDLPKTTVEVRGFSKDISKDTLEMYFENRKRSGGGPISNIEWKDEVALITFESEAATNAVLQRSHNFNGMDLDVKLYVPPKPVPMYLDKVLITGLNEKITEDCLINFLEARGGVSFIEILYAEDDEQKALVTFESPPDLQKLQEACQKKKLEGATLVVSQVPISRCVLVTNLVPKTSEDMVHLYFENTRRSGGGPVEKVEMNKEAGACLIYFEDLHVLDSVLGREHSLDNTEIQLQLFHPCISRTTSVDNRGKFQKSESFVSTNAVSKRNQKLNGMDLDVKLCVPPKPVPMYLDKVLITGLNEKIAEDCLTNFLEAKGGVSPTEILYAEDDEQKALVTFESPPDLQKLKDACQKKKLEGAMLIVSQVPISRCVLATNLAPMTSEETVYLYFENTRCSGGGPVEKVEMNKEAGACLIYFEDLHVLDLVLGRKHTLDNSEIQLQLFHPCIGRTSSVENRGKLQNPESFICKVNIHIIAFLKKVPNAKVRLEQEMSKVHGRLEVSSDNLNTLEVFPMLTAEMEGVKRLVKTWKETAEQKLEECMKQLDCMEHQIMSDLWVSTLADLEKIQIPNPEDVIVCTDQQHSIIRVVGFKDMVSHVSNNLKQIIHDGEKELELKKQRTSDKKILPKREIYFLSAVNFPDKVHMKCREVKCTIQQKDDIIIFEGILLDIKQAKILMYETIQTIRKSSLPDYSKSKLELLALKETGDYLKQKLEEKGCLGVWEIDGSCVIVYDVSDQKANEGIQIIKKCLVENTINMTPEQRPVINSDAWKAMLADINRQHQGHTIIHVQNSTIEITATDQYAGKIIEIVQDFISANALYKQTVTVNPRKIRYLEQWKRPKIDEICKSLQTNMVTIDLSQGVITLQGTQKGLREAESRMSTLLKQMCCKQTSLEKPGICKYLCSDKGEELIKHIEYVNKCTIDLTNPEDDPTSPEESKLELQKHLQHPVKYLNCRMFGGRTLSVFHGDITDLDIHILISPCNKTLDHSGGLAKVVIEKGGAVILGECSQLKHQKLMDGDVVCTRGGNLKCKIVAHGVSPIWQGGKDNEEEYLKEVVLRSLKETDRKKLTSIGIPAIGTGISRWPVSVATLVIIRTVHGYFQEHSNSIIKNVCLCDLDVQHVKSFIDAVMKVFPNDDLTFHENLSQTAAIGSSSLERSSGRSLSSSWSDSSGTSAHRIEVVKKEMAHQQAFEKERKEFLKPSKQDGSAGYIKKRRHGRQTYSDEASTTPNNPQFSEYIQVPQLKIISGDITTCSVDAIVNPTDAVVCLDGGVSTAILKKAGAELKEMCSTLGNKMKKKGIVVTPGFKLSCGFIIHVNVRDQQDGWKGIILKCLKEAVKMKLWSIAFPALGTGNVGRNPEEIGKALFEASCEIIQAGSSSLQEIQVVVFESQMVSKIEEGIKSAQESVPKASTWWQDIIGYLGYGKGKSAAKPHVLKADGMKVFVYVCADSESVVQDTIDSLETKFNHELDTDAITDELIKRLSEDKVSEIEEIGRKFDVMIKLEKRIGRVRIEGPLAGVGKVKNEVLNLMRSIEKMENKKQKAEMLSQLVQWYHIKITKEGQDLVEYAKDINATIEEAYQRKEKILKLHADSGLIIIDFDALEEYPAADPDDKVKVLRKGKIKDSVSEMPLQWDPLDKDNLKVIAVQTASQEYADVASHFMATVKKENKDASVSIAKIERIQNKTLYAQYQSKKKLIDEMNPGQINEMDLWHGTAEQAVDSINLHGFNRSFCGKNATLYGDGVYFARDACYSVRDLYNPVDAAGNKRMYLTKVLTGKYAKGDKGMRVPPPLVSGRPELHDCVVDDVDNPCIFVIFHDTQAYPEYLIIFKWN